MFVGLKQNNKPKPPFHKKTNDLFEYFFSKSNQQKKSGRDSYKTIKNRGTCWNIFFQSQTITSNKTRDGIKGK